MSLLTGLITCESPRLFPGNLVQSSKGTYGGKVMRRPQLSLVRTSTQGFRVLQCGLPLPSEIPGVVLQRLLTGLITCEYPRLYNTTPGIWPGGGSPPLFDLVS